jgi:hypothetical protein
MKIYFAHSSTYPNFEKELYEPMKMSELSKKHQFILPHENRAEGINSKELIANCDLVLAEISFLSTGMGIELGWADMLERKIVCIHKEGLTPSLSIRFISQNIVRYRDSESMIKNILSAMSDI